MAKKSTSKKSIDLSRNVKPKTLLIILSIVMFGLVGLYALTMSSAAPNTNGLNYVSHSLAPSATGAGFSVAEDYVVGFQNQQVVQIGSGGTVSFGGKGGGNPIFIKQCYMLKPVDDTAIVELWGINSSQQFQLGTQGSYQEACITKSRKEQTFPGYSVKVLSGKVNVFYQATHYTF